MATSQVEIASPSPPFGCVLRDHNRRDQCKESNARANLQKNLKDLVRDRLQPCISDTNGDCSVHSVPNEQNNNDDNKSKEKKSKIQQRWAQAREMVGYIPKIENGVKNHKKAKITREMMCNMLQIDNDDFSIKGEQSSENGKNQKKPKARETEQSNIKEKNHDKKLREMVCNMLQIDADHFSINDEQSSEKDKNQKKPKARETEQSSIKEKIHDKKLQEMIHDQLQIENMDRSAQNDKEKNHELKMIREIVSNQLQSNNERNLKKLKVQERWARAREKVYNQPQSGNSVDCSLCIEQSKERNHKKSDNTTNCPVPNAESKNSDKNQKTSKNQERWARVRENVSNNHQKHNVDSVVQSNSNDKNQKKSKSNNEDYSVQESKEKNLKKSKSGNEDCSVQEEGKNNDKNLKKLRTHERWARAREMVSNRQGVSSPLLGGGVSSLLRKWKGYEAEAKSLNSNTSTNTSPGCSIKSNSGITFIENSSPYHELPPSYECSEPTSADERDSNVRIMNIDAFPDWESDKISVSGPPSSISRDSDITAEEKEKVRVVDLIRKLTSTKITQQGCSDEIREGEQMLSSNESLPRVGTEILSCPRVRGRQAFSNLLMQIERDRQRELESLGERKAVSKFSHKGRIQALLKVRLMHRLAKIRDHATPNSPISAQLNRGPQGSHIMHLRERFCTGGEHGNKELVENAPSTKDASTSNQIKEDTHPHGEVDKKNSSRNMVDNTKCVENNTSTSNQSKEEICHHDVTNPKNSGKDVVHNVQSVETSSTQLRESKLEIKPCEDVEANREQNTSKADNQGSPSYDVCNIESLDEGNDEQQPGSHRDRIKETSQAQTIWEDIESCQDWLSDISQLRSEWEQMCNDQQLVETNHDWISEVARPRSDWEDLRQARYQEMLDPSADNGDIRQLLERKSVSSFLSSNMRDAIDQLMVSRMQKQSPRVGTSVAKCKEEADEENYDKLKYEDHSNDDYDDGDGDGHLVERQFDEFNKYTPRTYPLEPHSQSLLSPWMDIQDIAVSDYSNQSSPYSKKYVPSNSSYRDNQHLSSFINSPSIEMEFIYDLRGHMEQLHQEMFEIRKSLKTCISMQVKLQRSMRRSVRNEGKESTQRATRKGRCCVCNEKRVDSLLYRCGHMCTCFKCAHDLQISTGRCPVCQAPILDIVRPCTNNR